MSPLPSFRLPRATAATRRLLPLAACALVALPACDGDDGTSPEGLRFGQVGEVRLQVRSPRIPQGRLEQDLVWRSEGPWRLEERIVYQDEVGDRTVHQEIRNAESLAGEYAIWIAQVNNPSDRTLYLFDPTLDPTLDPDCAGGELTLTIVDDVRNEEISWTRCVRGTFASFDRGSAGPDLDADNLAEAATLLAGPTTGEGFKTAYLGSAPFATIAKGEDSKATLPSSRVIMNDQEWDIFWRQHTGTTATPPEVDFERDLVLVGAVGERREAGDSVEIRSVIPATSTTAVRIVERIPGDFCSPVERVHTPFHIVRAPRAFLPLPVEFLAAEPELVPCGV